MNQSKYNKFMQYLYNEYVTPRIPEVQALDRDRKLVPSRELGFQEYWARAREAVRLLRFIYTSSYSRDGFEEGTNLTFTAERLNYLELEVIYGVRNYRRLAETAGFLDALDEHYEDIVDGMKFDDLPRADLEILRELGSVDPASELSGLIISAKSKRSRQIYATAGSLNSYINTVETKLIAKIEEGKSDEQREAEVGLHEQYPKQGVEESRNPAPRRSRPWWTALGTIAKGAALSGANIGLSAGLLHYPVDPATQSWGALLSSIAGFGDIFTGIGKLFRE